ncbi:MAG: hypothetical protein ABI585_04035 [Betaproteobacteria bacterium]
MASILRSLAVGASALAVALVAAPVAAQEACKSAVLKNPAVKLDDIYRTAEAHAKAWKPDVVPVRISNTINGPLKPDGSSDAWIVSFFSPSANAHVAVNTFRGGLNCWAQPGGAGRVPDLKPGFVIDGARLYAIARENGDKYLADGYFVQIGTAAAPSSRHATWNLQYSKPDGKTAPILVVVDANSGKVEKVIRQ